MPRGPQSRSRPLSRKLLAWYDREKRDLPWRRGPTPYRTLVSELMLQQTVVATVVPYFERFVRRFPDLRALAAADEEEVLTLWSGLGYYSRARNLHKTARAAVASHGGALPPSEEELRRLPGVGPYTAAAVAAIAFGARTFALDGNAARVVARLFVVREPIDLPESRERLRALGTSLVPADRPGDFAQAVMELGARVCVPRAPRCGDCPVAPFCEARAAGAERTLPVRAPRAAKRPVRLACAAVERRGRLLLVRRPAGGLLGGTWALPAAELDTGEVAGRDDGRALGRALGAVGLTAAERPRALGEVRHIFTHRDVTAPVYRLGARGRLEPTVPARWVSASDLAGLALSSFTRKTLALLGR